MPEIPGAVGQDGTQLAPTPNDPRIRTLALLSQLAVFRDIVPGYRIRALTEHERAEKVSQMVQRTRDWEQGLVGVYQNYLKLLEAEVKGMLPSLRVYYQTNEAGKISQIRARPGCVAMHVYSPY